MEREDTRAPFWLQFPAKELSRSLLAFSITVGPEGRPAMLNVAIVGTFAASLEDAIRRNLTVPCEIIVSDEAEIISGLADIDVLVTMVPTRSRPAPGT